MQESYLLLLGFCSWTVLILMLIGALRTWLTLTCQRRANNFAPSGEDISPFSHRLCRTHANCYENLPIVIGIIGYAYMTNNLAITNTFAIAFLVFRILQSITHLISTSVIAVSIRFAFFTGQYAIILYWLYHLWLVF